MADLKISELTNLTAADPANDMIPIVDVSATPPASGSTKRISINNILACSPTATLASATITGDLTVDTSTLKVDSANNRVGIGTATPARPLDIVGSFQSSLGWVLTGTPAGLGAATRYIGGASTTDSWYYNAVTGGSHLWAFGESLAMTLNSTGLGVGVTPSAWWSSTKALQFGLGGSISGRTDTGARSYFASNAFLNSSPAWTYVTTNFATRYEQNDGTHQWFTAPSGTAGTAISFTQAMTLDASGNLLVGTTSGTFRGTFVVAGGANRDILAAGVTAVSDGFQVKWNHATTKINVIISNMPTSSAGLAAGTLWNDAGTIKIA